MDYNENYMLTHDIDWFCIVSGIYVHLASAGGILPLSFRDRDALRTLQHNIAVAPYQYEEEDIMYNDAFLSQRFADNAKGRTSYIVSFREMARKGFVSMDRTNLMKPGDNHYHVVCWPRRLNEQRIEIIEIPVIADDEKPDMDFRPLGLLEQN